MLAHRYKVWSWGGQRTDGQDDCLKYDVGVTVVAKRHKYNNYEVFNEVVCTELGRCLGLPIPVGSLVDKDDHVYYCSGNVAPGNEFPEADLTRLAINEASTFCGILVFDAWVLNADRHARNIFYSEDDRAVFLIDHGGALLGSQGKKRLLHNEDRLLLFEGYTDALRDLSEFCSWYEVIARIPENFIHATARRAAGAGIEESEATETANWLIKRRSRLIRLFSENRPMFPNMIPSLFTPFTCDDDPTEYCI